MKLTLLAGHLCTAGLSKMQTVYIRSHNHQVANTRADVARRRMQDEDGNPVHMGSVEGDINPPDCVLVGHLTSMEPMAWANRHGYTPISEGING